MVPVVSQRILDRTPINHISENSTIYSVSERPSALLPASFSPELRTRHLNYPRLRKLPKLFFEFAYIQLKSTFLYDKTCLIGIWHSCGCCEVLFGLGLYFYFIEIFAWILAIWYLYCIYLDFYSYSFWFLFYIFLDFYSTFILIHRPHSSFILYSYCTFIFNLHLYLNYSTVVSMLLLHLSLFFFFTHLYFYLNSSLFLVYVHHYSYSTFILILILRS